MFDYLGCKHPLTHTKEIFGMAGFLSVRERKCMTCGVMLDINSASDMNERSNLICRDILIAFKELKK